MHGCCRRYSCVPVSLYTAEILLFSQPELRQLFRIGREADLFPTSAGRQAGLLHKTVPTVLRITHFRCDRLLGDAGQLFTVPCLMKTFFEECSMYILR